MDNQTLPQDDIVIDNKAIYYKLATALNISAIQVASFANLYDEGASVPFIARYRKDKTGGLDDDILRQLEKNLIDERDLAKRRIKIKELLKSQDKLSDELIAHIDAATSKLQLEDIYAPHRPRRRSLSAKATLAGLDGFAKRILAGEPLSILNEYTPVSQITDAMGESLEVDYSTFELQLAGIQAIVLDEWATHLDLLDKIRLSFNKTAQIVSQLADESKREVGEKFKDYFDYTEPFTKLSSHRLLAMLRGRQQNVLALKVQGESEPFIAEIVKFFGVEGADDRSQFLQTTAKKLWTDKWQSQLEHRLLTEYRLTAEAEAIGIFAKNLHHLLMTAPAGQKVILGIDPGFRHGVKMAVIDSTGTPIATKTIYPFAPDHKLDEAKAALNELIATHNVELVAIGNGTASRETEQLVKEVIKSNALAVTALVISEAGASVYSASEIASSELPTLDVSLRGAVSIARRLQDPLSELVKVEPKAIGVGQYQHDVNQAELENSLDKVTEDCVNAVGVDVNTASPSILAHIAGLNKNVAQQIVNYRNENGAFTNREELKAVPRLGAKTFEQAAGFLRIKSGNEPLDATGVHPESYGLIYAILNDNNISIEQAIGNSEIVSQLKQGIESLSPLDNALTELAKSRHDPRGSFRTAKFREDVTEVQDLAIGMELEGVVTNVTGFGCFVDIGVHQEGLVHISELSDHFVEDPNDIVKPSDIVKVRVIGVDEKRARISLSMKKEPSQQISKSSADKPKSEKPKSDSKSNRPKLNKPRADKPKKEETKIGSFGMLLQQAGIK